MTSGEIQSRMVEIDKFTGDRQDTEVVHSLADDLLCDILTGDGHQDVVQWFKALAKWYA